MGGQEHRDGRKFCGLVTVETTSASFGLPLSCSEAKNAERGEHHT